MIDKEDAGDWRLFDEWFAANVGSPDEEAGLRAACFLAWEQGRKVGKADATTQLVDLLVRTRDYLWLGSEETPADPVVVEIDEVLASVGVKG